jgi:hypothetical protein
LETKAASVPIKVNRMRAHLRKIFNWAITAEILEVNPVYLIAAPAKQHQQERVLTEDEIKRVWKAIDAEIKPFAAFVAQHVKWSLSGATDIRKLPDEVERGRQNRKGDSAKRFEIVGLLQPVAR